MSPRVFMVEDDAAIVAVVRPAAEREGLSFASHGRAGGAVAAMRDFRPDLVVLDVELPDGDGYGVCRELRAVPALAEVPVLFLTSKGDVTSRLEGFAAGGQDYVVKPFAVEELCARLRAHLLVKRRQDVLAGEVDELSLRERIRQDMSDMIIHDLRSPLSTVKITLELFRDSGVVDGTQYARLLESAEGALDFMLLMVGDLLDLGAGRVKVEPGVLDLAALAARLEGLVAPQAERRKMSFTVARSGDAKVVTDQTLVFRVLVNLSFNAVKFSRSGQTVAVKLLVSPAGLRAEVLDQGPGVPDAEKEKIFLKYHRSSESLSGHVPGSGIGLAFCRLAVDSLGGRIWVEDAPGGGSRFIFEAPPLDVPAGAAELFGPEVMAAYAGECRSSLEKARGFAARIPGPGAEDAVKGAKAVAHRLSGSAGTYGFDEAGRTAKSLEKTLEARLTDKAPLDEGLRRELLAAIDVLARQLSLPPAP